MALLCHRYDSAEMLCAVFWESVYSDMLVYILCAFSICIFLPFLLMLLCSLLSSIGYGKNCNKCVITTTRLHSFFTVISFILFVTFYSYTSFSLFLNSSADLSSVAPLLVVFYLLCYTPFAVSEVRLTLRFEQVRMWC